MTDGTTVVHREVTAAVLMKEVAKDCILQIQLKIPRSGNTPENQRSWKHIDDIAARYGIVLPDDMLHFYGMGLGWNLTVEVIRQSFFEATVCSYSRLIWKQR